MLYMLFVVGNKKGRYSKADERKNERELRDVMALPEKEIEDKDS